jgi:RalA-binding protein 1
MPAMAHRTASIDSTVSSISSTNSHRANPSTNTFRVPQDVQGPQDAAALIASAGSAEAALHKVLGEKQQAANHNAQLWRLVEKQRAMILGLNRDLEKSLKEKERYRRKLKDHLAQSSSAPALTSSNISQSPRQFVSTPTSARDISVDTLKTSDTSGSVPNSAVGRSDTPQDATAPQSARLENTQTRNEFQREPEPSAPASGDTNAAFQSPKSPKSPASPHPSSGYASPKTRKAPPAPLKLTSNEPQIEIVNHIIDASDSEYEEDPTSARSEHADRGRRKTREDDDREREVLLQKEVEQRSRSKKEKKSKSRPGEKIDVPLAAAGEPPVDEAARLQGPFFQPASSDDFRDPIIVDGDHGTPSQRLQVVTHSGLLSPGLPLSPRPGDRPPNSPMPRAPNGQVANSIPLSPRAGMNGGMPLSPRAPRAPIPLPPQTPISLMSPHLDRAKAYAQQTSSQTQSPSVPADRLRSNSEQSPDNAPSSMSSDHFSLHTPGEIYRGLQTEQYPDLLLPPNALASIYVKIASSRMIRSRASMIAPRIADDNPVFTMSVHARSDNKELWRIEKTFASLWALDHEVKSMTKMRAPMPDKTLFTGHAPAKIDARRMVLNAYFERMLDAVTEEKAARVICKFLSTDSFAGDGGDYFGTVSDVRRPESPAQKLRTNMAGYLTKRGKNFGGWKARYFVLDGPNFKYYEGPGGAHLGSIKLPNAQIGKQSINPNQSSNDDEDNQFRHAFLILEPKKKDSSSLVRHVLCAESDEERDQWVDALLHYVDYKEDEDQQPWRQAQVSKVEPTVPYSPRSPRLQKSTQDLRAGNSGSSGHGRSADLHAVGYNETVAGNAPVMGTTPATRTSDTPSPPYDKLVADSAPHPLISAPTNLQVIQNTGEWGMKVPPTPGKDRKRSVFQLPFGRGRSSSDLDPSEAMRSPGVKAPERPYREPSRAVFGLPLAEAVEVAHPEAMAAELPSVVYRCIQYLTARNAVAEEGIFRLSGSNTVIRSLKERFSTEGDINLLEDEISYDIHAVASLLKLYLRELPASILTRDFHLDFLHCLEMQHDEKVAAVRALVHKLPRPNFALLDTLSAFMLLIVKNVSVNKMNVRNRKSLILLICEILSRLTPSSWRGVFAYT